MRRRLLTGVLQHRSGWSSCRAPPLFLPVVGTMRRPVRTFAKISGHSPVPVSPSAPVGAASEFGAGVPSQRPHRQSQLVYAVEPQHHRGSFRRFLLHTMNASERRAIAGALAGGLLSLGSALGAPLVFGQLLDGATTGELPRGSSTLLFALFSLSFAGHTARHWCLSTAAQSITYRWRCQVFRAALSPQDTVQQVAVISRSVPERVALDCREVGAALSDGVSGGLQHVLLLCGSAGMMLFLSPVLTGATAGLIVPLVTFVGVYGRLFKAQQAAVKEASTALKAVAAERLAWLPQIRALGHEEKEVKWFAKSALHCQKMVGRTEQWNAVYIASIQFIGCGGLLCLSWAGSLLVASAQITFGTFFAFTVYSLFAVQALVGAVRTVRDVNRGYAAWLRVSEVLKQCPSPPALPSSPLKTEEDRLAEVRSLTFQDVSLCHPRKPDQSVLCGVTTPLFPQGSSRPPRVTCIVSDSAATMSAMAHVLAHIRCPTNGAVLTARDTDELNVFPHLHRAVGYVGPEPMLLEGSVEANIAYGSPEYEWGDAVDPWRRAAVVEAAMRAGIHERIAGLPQGYRTTVAGPRYNSEQPGTAAAGYTTLTKLEQEGIALARVLLQHPTLLVLDQVTSGLNPPEVAALEQVIQNLCAAQTGGSCCHNDKAGKADKTHLQGIEAVVICTTALGLVELADHIVVLDGALGGKLVASGSMEEVHQNGCFQRVVHRKPVPLVRE